MSHGKKIKVQAEPPGLIVRSHPSSLPHQQYQNVTKTNVNDISHVGAIIYWQWVNPEDCLNCEAGFMFRKSCCSQSCRSVVWSVTKYCPPIKAIKVPSHEELIRLSFRRKRPTEFSADLFTNQNIFILKKMTRKIVSSFQTILWKAYIDRISSIKVCYIDLVGFD